MNVQNTLLSDLLRQLIAVPSPSGQEQKLAQFIFDWSIQQQLPAFRQGPNVVISFRNGSNRCLIFNGHMDTVGPGNRSSWREDPFSGILLDNKIYGLGSSDMKSALACFLILALALKEQPPPIDVFFSFVVEEETSSAGSRSFVEYFSAEHKQRYQSLGCIIGEPTDLQYAEFGHRGSHFVRIRAQGQAGHASRSSSFSILAIDSLLAALRMLQVAAVEWSAQFSDSALGPPLMTVTSLKSAPTSPNQTPEWAEAIIDFRTTPLLAESLIDKVQAIVGATCQVQSLETPTSPTITRPESAIVRALQQTMPALDLRMALGANDCYLFNACGIPAITFGPGLKETIHKPNEHVPCENLEAALEIYKKLLLTF